MPIIDTTIDIKGVKIVLAVLILGAAGATGATWVFSIMPKETVIQTTYGSDGSVTIDSEVLHPRTGVVEKCSARFNAIADSTDSVRLVAVSKNCEYDNTPAMLDKTIQAHAE
jgi:hypothetical protein